METFTGKLLMTGGKNPGKKRPALRVESHEYGTGRTTQLFRDGRRKFESPEEYGNTLITGKESEIFATRKGAAFINLPQILNLEISFFFLLLLLML